MPHTYTKQQLEEQYQRLPDILKDALFSTEVAEALFEIGRKNGITVDRIGLMAEETGRVILGLTRPKEFVSILSERLNMDTDAAQKIASEINRRVFSPLQETLKSTHKIDINESAIRGEITIRPPQSMPEAQKQKVSPIISEPPKTVRPAPLAASPFLSRQEIEKVVAEKRTVAQPIDLRTQQPPAPLPPQKPLEKPAVAPHQPSEQPPRPAPATLVPPALEFKTPPLIKNHIDLRAQPQAPVPKPPALATQPLQKPAEQSSAATEPSAKTTQIDLRQTPLPPKPPTPAENPKPKARPWQGYDPYRESVD